MPVLQVRGVGLGKEVSLAEDLQQTLGLSLQST